MRPRLWALSFAGLLLAACGGPDDATPPGGGTLVITNTADVDGINPLLATNSEISGDLARLLFLSLMEREADYSSGPPGWEPRLAESWERSEDGWSITFRLRAGVLWSDGTPVTAADVRWSWRAQTAPEIGWYAAAAKAQIEDVEVLDDLTVRFHFSADYADQLLHANEGPILPQHAWGERPFSEWSSDGRWFVDNFVGSGPFVLDSWEPNQQIALRGNPHYYRSGLPRVERVVVRIVPDKSGQINQLLGGTIDYVQIVPADELPRLERAEEIEIETFWGRGYDYIAWNTRVAPLDDPRVRRALTQAIDRQTIIDSIYAGHGRIAISPILSSTWAFDDRLEPWPYDPQRARAILEELGLREEPLELELQLIAAGRMHQDVAVMLQEQLGRIGVDLRLRPVEFGTWLQRLSDGEFEASLGLWNIPSSLDVGFAFHSDSIGGYNWTGYSNVELDSVIDEWSAETDEARRLTLFRRIQRILHEDQPYTFLFEQQKINARNRRVRGSRPNVISSFHNLAEWWLDDS